jgi:hypothetical protein
MNFSFARHVFAWVVLAAIVAALFRVATAPERIADRRNTARNVCLSSGGEWVTEGRDEICRRPAPAPKS